MMDLIQTYNRIMVERADPRTNDWPLVRSPIPLTIITIGYLYFILRCGPRFMKNRQPYSFQTFIRFYDIMQIVANALIVYHIFEAGWYEDYFLYCVKPEFSYAPKPYKLAKILWYVLLLKLVDYIETILFVLRKKQRQVSFLHVYHHVSTAYLGWLALKYFAHGMSMMMVVVNCSVHVVMYFYYLLTSLGPKMQRILTPIKPAITIIQMVQFLVLIIHAGIAFIPGCPDVKTEASLILVNLTINFILFYRFYQENYTKKNK